MDAVTFPNGAMSMAGNLKFPPDFDPQGGYAVNATMTDHRIKAVGIVSGLDGGTHMDFYDVPKYVDRAVAEATPFFEKHLAAQTN